MSYLYIDDPGISLRVDSNRLLIKNGDNEEKGIPIETVEGITVLKRAQFSGKCLQVMLEKEIPVAFFSKGYYCGRLQSAGHVNVNRQRLQCSLYDTDFSLGIAKRIVIGKIRNQEVVLRRYGKSRGIPVQEHINRMQRCCEKADHSKTIEELMGNEGYAARIYFAGLAIVIETDFMFQGRNKRPSRDEFNVLLNLGYSVLVNLLYGSIEVKGLNPYFGFLHRDREGHPTLASDLMEEWRPIIVDSAAMSIINGHELHKSDFYMNEEGACILGKEGRRLYLRKIEEKLKVKVRYMKDIPYSVSFRQGILLQIDSLIRAMEAKDPDIYYPIQIR